MGRGSYFELLKETKENSETGKCRKPDNETEKTGRFVRTEDRTWGNLLDSSDGTLYESVLHLGFNSLFSSLREHYEETERISPYEGEDSHVISPQEASEMIVAIDYVLLGKFDVDIEEVMKNRFVEIFGTMDRRYSLWKYRNDFPEDKEYSGNDIEDLRESLREIRTILGAYLMAEEDREENGGKYLLRYVIW